MDKPDPRRKLARSSCYSFLMLLLPHHPAVSSARTVGTKCDGVAEPRRNGLVREADGGESHHGRGGAEEWIGKRSGWW